MSPLSSDQVLKDNNTHDRSAIEALNLTHRALSDVSFCCDFKNLARLDLKLNKLTSLEGLKLCTNLKWLSVAENKLESLKGIESLSKLNVFNAGKNKLKSMEEVRSVTSLRALILNDNEISSIRGLDKMKDLNTLVLSKNPIGEIGESLLKLKSITKLSLSYCQLQNLSTSLKSCFELKELRLAHNDIKSLPAELVHNKDLQNLDLGYNVITRWSDLKVLNSFANLRNLNLQGNPVAANDKSVKKIRKMLPNLHVFNAKPIDKHTKNEKGDKIVKDTLLLGGKNLEIEAEDKRDHIKKRDFKDPVMGQERDANLMSASGLDRRKKLNGKQLGAVDNASEVLSDEAEERDDVEIKKSKHPPPRQSKVDKLENDLVLAKQPKQKREVENEKLQKRKGPFQDEDDADAKKKRKKISTVKRGQLIDDSEVSFAELLAANGTEGAKYETEKKVIDNASETMKSASGMVTISAKRKKAISQGSGSVPEHTLVVEVGLGGPSTWGDE